jgi:hypothetical protein
VGPRAGLKAMARGKYPIPCRASNASRPAGNLITILNELQLMVKVKLSCALTKHHDMKTYWGMEV